VANLFLGFPVSRAKIAEMIEGSAPPIAHAPWHKPDGQDPLVLPADITAGQAVGWDGTKYKGYSAGGAGGPDLLTNFFFQTFFESLDGFVQYLRYTGAITLYDYAAFFSTGTTINSRARLYKRCSVPTPGLTWNKKRELVVRASLTQSAAGCLSCRLWTGYDYNKYGFGFLIEANYVMGECAGGTGPSQVVLEEIPAGAYTWSKYLRAVLTPTSKVEFYIDGVKKGELTSNLPTGLSETYYLLWITLENLTAANEQAYVSMWKLFQEA
jgi:hypothetical protein